MIKFKKIYLFTLFCLLASICVRGNSFDSDTLKRQPRSKKPEPKPLPNPKPQKENRQTDFELGAGIMGSVLYLSRNIKQNNDAKGVAIVANYGGHKLYRISAQFTHYFPINIEPTWYSIKANTIEANIEIIASFKNEHTKLYPFVGLSYNTFKGFFTGTNDYLNLREKYKANTTVQSRWLGLNIGTGIEHSFGPVVIYGDYKMRVGKEQTGGFNIMDVCYSAGIRIKISFITLRPVHVAPPNRYHHYRSNVKKTKNPK